MNFIDRLQYYMAQKDINDNKLTVDAGLSIGLIGKAKKSGKAMNSVNIEKILLAYPDLNPDWLLTGRGEMLKSNMTNTAPSKIRSSSTICKDDKIQILAQENNSEIIETRPRIPFDAAAGSLSIAMPGVSSLQCEQFPLIPTLPDYDFTIIARGDSMTPDILSGDELACVFVQESKFIQWGRPHVLDTAQGIVLKRIFNQKDAILCRSVNHDYPDFEIPKDEIYHLAIVVGLIRHF